MKGDKFLEMAARCGDLPDSVMAVPGLEYVGVQSASWEALCVRAAGWGGADVHGYLDPLDLRAFRPQCYASTLDEASWVNGLAGLARLMAIVTKDQT